MTSPYHSVVPGGASVKEDPYSEVGAPFTPIPVQGYVNYTYEVGRKGKAPGQFGGWIQHFAPSKDGKLLYVCDLWNKRIQAIDLLKRKPVFSFPTTISDFNFQAQGIQVFRNGNLCVNCVGFDGTSRIGIFSPEGRKIRSFGPGVIGSTSAIAVDSMDRITVIDRRKMRISTCSVEGRLLESFDPGIKTDLLRLCCNSKGHVIIPNHLSNQVVVFDPYGSPIRLIRPLSGCGYEFKYPAGVTCDCDDNIFVSDVGNHRVLQFNADCEFRGALLTKRDHKLWRPHDVVATSQGDMVVNEVSETFLKIFNFSPKEY